MFTRLGRFTVRRRRWVLSASVVFVVVAGVLGTGAFGVLKGGGFEDPDSESFFAAEQLEAEFGERPADVVVIVEAVDGDADSAATTTAATDLTAQLAEVADDSNIVSYWQTGAPPLRSTAGDAGLLLISYPAGFDDDQNDALTADLLAVAEAPPAGVTVQVGGFAAVFEEVNRTIERDLGVAQMIALPLTLLLLLVIFRGVVAAGLPLIIGMMSILGTLLILFVLGSITDVSIYSINLATALGLGLGIDFSLFMVSRFREELDRGLDVDAAVVRTVESAGRTIFFSGATTALSLSALYVFPLFFLQSFAYSGVAVVALATAAAVITLPALLAVVGTKVNALSVRRAPSKPVDEGRLARFAQAVMRRPLPVAAAVIALLIAVGLPFTRAEFSNPDHRVLPADAPARMANETLGTAFDTNESNAFGVVVRGAAGDVDTVADLAATVSALDRVARVDSAAGVHVAGAAVAPADASAARFTAPSGTTWLNVVPSIEPASADGEALVADIRDLDGRNGLELAVGGSAATIVDTKAAIGGQLPLVAVIIVVATLGLLLLLLRSLVLPVKALVLNLLSLTAMYGAMVWIFQDGNLSGLLDFTATGALDTTMPILMFCVAFGLSIDYEVFLLSRISEEYQRTGDTRLATARGLQRTGGIVTASAALLSITFLAFAVGDITFIKLFGVGLSLAVLADAFFIRPTLVPAFMALVGDRTWSAPAWLRRLPDLEGDSGSGGVTIEPVVVPDIDDEVPTLAEARTADWGTPTESPTPSPTEPAGV